MNDDTTNLTQWRISSCFAGVLEDENMGCHVTFWILFCIYALLFVLALVRFSFTVRTLTRWESAFYC
jgi:hypothetical protein